MGNATTKMNNLNKAKQTFGFLSMTVSWMLMNIGYSVYLTLTYGKTDDSGVIIFWSGLFMLVAWLLFIVLPLKFLDHSRNIFKPQIFPFITAVYASLTFSVIVGTFFRSWEIIAMFLPLAVFAGSIFGLSYAILIRMDGLLSRLAEKPMLKSLFFVSPVFIFSFFLWFLPAVIPSVVFRYMPDNIQDKIVARTIPKFKVGDNFKDLANSLPGYFSHFEDGNGNLASTTSKFSFVLQVACNRIARLEYSTTNSIDMTIYGTINEPPCP